MKYRTKKKTLKKRTETENRKKWNKWRNNWKKWKKIFTTNHSEQQYIESTESQIYKALDYNWNKRGKTFISSAHAKTINFVVCIIITGFHLWFEMASDFFFSFCIISQSLWRKSSNEAGMSAFYLMFSHFGSSAQNSFHSRCTKSF